MSFTGASVEASACERRFAKNAAESFTGMDMTSTMVLPAMVAAQASGLRRAPWQAGHARSLR